MVDDKSTPDIPEIPQKQCRVCQEFLPATTDYFHKYKKSKDGLRTQCTQCVSAENRARRLANPEKICAQRRAQNRAYRLANPEKLRAKSRTYYLTNAEKIRAHQLANPEKIRAKNRAYQLANSEKLCAKKRVCYLANSEKLRAKQRAYCLANPEKKRAYRLTNSEQIRAKNRAYQMANPERIAEKNARRRARKAGAPINDFTEAQWQALQIAFDHRCAYCGKRCAGKEKLTKDHVTPYHHNGSNTLWNIVPACRSCNCRKKDGPVPVPVQPLLLL